MNPLSRGIKNAFRNATRTVAVVVILGLSIGLAFVMLIAHQAVDNKISTTLSSVGTSITIRPAGFVFGSGVNNALTATQVAALSSVPHLSSLTMTLNDRLQTTGTTSSPQATTSNPQGDSGAQTSGGQFATRFRESAGATSLQSPTTLNCSGNTCSGGGGGGGIFVSGGPDGGAAPSLPSNFSLPLTIVGTSNPTDPTSIGATSLKIISGTPIFGSVDSSSAMVSSAIATKNSLSVGSTFTAYTKTLTVAAIFDSGTQAGNDTLIVSLPTLQNLSGQADAITNATAAADSLANLSGVTSAIKNQLGTSADVTSNVDQANQALAPLSSVKDTSFYSLIGAVIAGAVIILLTMVMIVRERKREIGTLKAIGFSNLRIMFQFMVEALTLTALALVIGLAIGVFGGNPVTSTLVSSSTATTTVSGGGPTSAVISGGRAGGGAFFTGRGGGAFGGAVRAFGNPIASNISNINAQIGWTTIWEGLVAAFAIALVGAAFASYFISRVRPAEALRSE